MLRVGVLVSGGGTNLQAILDAEKSGALKSARVVYVLSSHESAYALRRAAAAGVPAECLSPGRFASREAYHEALLACLQRQQLDLIVLAGFLVRIPVSVIRAYRGRMINIHPSLIPSFCGKGCYGLAVHEAALRRGVKVTGATVHLVDEDLDSGPILLQKAVEVRPGDTPELLQRRVMEEAEWKLLPAAIEGIANGSLRREREDCAMKILVVGSGGREHAICWKLSQSPKAEKIYCAPGNAGIAELAECVPIGVMEFERLADFAEEQQIGLTVVGMDDPLIGGLVDVFEARGLRVFGPRKNAAILEGSKAFSKELMKKYGIPTAQYETFTDAEAALAYVEQCRIPVVLKADGPALGKGVLICMSREEAVRGIRELMIERAFGASGDRVVVEEFMTGREVSVLSFVDGKTIRTMASAQDHKRARDGDQGLNTGGMGNFSPSPFYTEEIDAFCRENVYQRTVDAMAAEGRSFKGVIFFGLMLTEDGPKVLEYNARFGDPEAQVVLPRMKNDLVDVFEACIDGTLDSVELSFRDEACVCVVLASDGYPVSYEKGVPMSGFEAFKGKEDYFCFHAGTARNAAGEIVTNGGRVLGITALGGTLKEARAKAYEATEWISFRNKYMRHDIAKAVESL